MATHWPWSRPGGGGEPLPTPTSQSNGGGRPHGSRSEESSPHLGGLRTLRAARCWAPGSLWDDGQVGSGEPSVRASWAEIHLLSWAGHWRVDLGWRLDQCSGQRDRPARGPLLIVRPGPWRLDLEVEPSDLDRE